MSLFQRKVLNRDSDIKLTEQEKKAIGLEEAEGIEECRESLAELGIRLD